MLPRFSRTVSRDHPHARRAARPPGHHRARQPERLQGLVLLANMLRATGDLAASVPPLRDALAMRFEPETAINLAEALTQGSEGRVPDEARALLAHAVAIAPRDARGKFYLGLADGEGWLRLARAERVLGNKGAALVALEKAAALLPNDARVVAERRALTEG